MFRKAFVGTIAAFFAWALLRPERDDETRGGEVTPPPGANLIRLDQHRAVDRGAGPSLKPELAAARDAFDLRVREILKSQRRAA